MAKYTILLGVIVLAVVIFIISIIAGEFAKYDAALANYRSNCAKAGGHIYQATSSSSLFCLTSDGRMLEVYPNE